MKFMVDEGFAKIMPWYAKVAFSIGMSFMDLGMRLSGLEPNDENENDGVKIQEDKE